MFYTLNDDQRKLFHAALADWLAQANEAEFDAIEALREEVAPGEVCSMLRLVRACFARADLQSRLPAALVALLRERNLLRPAAALTMLANAAGRP